MESGGYKRTRIRLIGPIAVLAVVFSLMGCAKALSPLSFFTDRCLIPPDQSGTIEGRWAYTPIPVGFKQITRAANNFTDDEIAAIEAAANTWNAFFGKSKGFPVLNYQDGTDLRKVTDSAKAQIYDQCNAPLVTATGFTGVAQNSFQDSVILHKVTDAWNRQSNRNGSSELIAITGSCTVNMEIGLNAAFTYSWIEINEVDFFRAGTKLPDLESILLHEFGHLLGLNHSCSQAGEPGFPGCGSNKAFDLAVMFPAVGFPDGFHGEVRKNLQLNDMYRANCLY